MSSCDGQIVWSRPPDPPLRTWEQAGSASLTVTLIPIELISHHTNQPPLLYTNRAAECPNVAREMDSFGVCIVNVDRSGFGARIVIQRGEAAFAAFFAALDSSRRTCCLAACII